MFTYSNKKCPSWPELVQVSWAGWTVHLWPTSKHWIDVAAPGRVPAAKPRTKTACSKQIRKTRPKKMNRERSKGRNARSPGPATSCWWRPESRPVASLEAWCFHDLNQGTSSRQAKNRDRRPEERTNREEKSAPERTNREAGS
jgi:hypothetical protein